MLKIIPNDVKVSYLHSMLLSAVAPRPISLVSTVDENGNVNLSPFSFFNVFGVNPTTLIFSPARRVRDNTIKHTLENCISQKECVINVVNYDIVQQISLSSVEYPKGVNEFVKAGLTEQPSEYVKAPRVAESPVQLECRVREVIETGTDGGAGNLVICEVLCMHVQDYILDTEGKIDPHKIDLVARMGGDYYCRASGDAVFTVPKPNQKMSIGIDQLPDAIRLSTVLTGSDLAQLASLEYQPDAETLKDVIVDDYTIENHLYAKQLIEENHLLQAWKVLLNL